MDWFFDNIQFVIAVAAAFAWWLSKRREGAAPEDEEGPPPLVPGQSDAEAEERARRIQEEIRRKIAQRQTLPPVAQPPVSMPDWAREEYEPPVIEEPRFDPAAAILEQQRQLEERLRLVEESRRKAAALRTQLAQPRLPRAVEAVSPRFTPGSLAAGLHNVAEVRRAILMREILGPPKGLQG